MWHAHSVWFLDANPVVGYSKLKDGVGLFLWSGPSFEETGLKKEGSSWAAEMRYTDADQVEIEKLHRWLAQARDIQWDYRNLVRRKGRAVEVRLATRISATLSRTVLYGWLNRERTWASSSEQ